MLFIQNFCTTGSITTNKGILDMRKLTIAGFALATALTAGCATTDQAAIDEATATANSAEQTASNALSTANNADRKGGACLRDRQGRIWAIDQGLTFNPYARMRTVMWEFSGEPWSDTLVDDIRAVSPSLAPGEALGKSLRELLSDDEVEALQDRLNCIIENPCFPVLDPQLNVPWPFL
mgnify:CR=1 FL=1